MRRHRCLAVAAALTATLAAPTAAAAHPQLPDLGMAPLQDFRIDRTADGRSLLRYTAIIVNIGAGSFEAHGSRAGSTGDMSVVQRISDSTGTSTYRATPATMVFGGDGHFHWHVRDLEESALVRLDNGVKVGSGAKHGFCFFDLQPFRLGLPGAPGSAFYRTCGTNSSVSSQVMGLSVGWADVYSYQLVDQWVDVSDVGPGRYRLTTTADAQNWFAESDELNNLTWVDLQLKAKGSPRVLAYGPSA